jgi:hypothetical protein
MSATLVPWFSRDRLPALVNDRAIVVGGTSLLGEFISTVAAAPGGGTLAIAAPFVARGIAQHISPWRMIRHAMIDLTLVTQSVSDAEAAAEVDEWPWRSRAICVSSRLHAKIYTFVGATGHAVCLVGSHNLTHGGFDGNQEAGTLFVTTRFSEMHEIIRACHDHVVELARHGRKYLDTLAWPAGLASASKGERT